MLRNSVSIQDTIDFLNALIDLDDAAIHGLISTRILCNEALANHSTVQVGQENNVNIVGILGLLNGLFGIDDNGWGPITIVYENGRVVRAERYLRSGNAG